MFTDIAKKFDLATRTLASLAAMLAVGAILLAGNAGAAPIATATSAIAQSDAQDSDVTLVRDGCGRGMRFSNRRQGCVPDGGGGVVYVDPGAAVVQGIIGGVVGAPRGCPRGMRWSNGRGTCVYY
jgi:hypothetical protein